MIPDYTLEKIEYTLRNLSYMAKDLNNCSISADDLKDRIQHLLYGAILNLTKAACSLTRTEWAEADVALFVSDPSKGLDNLLVKYGRLTATKEDKIRAIEKHLIEECLKLLDSTNAAPSRTLLHETLFRFPNSNPIIQAIRNDLEKVHQGQKTWKDFCVEAKLGILKM